MGFIKRRVRRAVRQRIRNPVRERMKRAATRHCAECGKRVEPFHTCAPRSDFQQRKARAARQRKTEQRRQRRKETAARRRATAAERRKTAKSASAPRRRERQPHPYETCTDQNCQRPACKAFKEGMQACPLSHV